MELKFFLCLTKQLDIDVQILLEKADMALKKHKMLMVVANEFLTRKDKVVVVTNNKKISIFHLQDSGW